MDITRKTSMKTFAIGLLAILFLVACGNSHDYSPKPRGYYRIVFPKKGISAIYIQLPVYVPLSQIRGYGAVR